MSWIFRPKREIRYFKTHDLAAAKPRPQPNRISMGLCQIELVTTEMVQRYIGTMKDRFGAVILAKGGHTMPVHL
uniref:Uncharacterized protein n=1 Tax=Daphnia galeata TaxID=27404 RepID=A0A8J2S001_9CRUS|nr:unnamed protein product [Daphnia galeata]